MKMARWSDLRVFMLAYSELMAMCEVEIDSSGEVGLSSEGSRMGESVLRSQSR